MEYCYGFAIYGYIWIAGKDQEEAYQKFLAMAGAKLADEGAINQVEHEEVQDEREE